MTPAIDSSTLPGGVVSGSVPGPRIRVALIHYMDSASIGGSLRVGELLGKSLQGTDIEPHFVFAYNGPGPVARGTDIPCHFVRAHGPKDFPGWARARRLIRAIRPDIVHFVNPVFWMRLALWDVPCPTVLHVHGPLSPATARFRERCIWRVFRHLTEAHICVSNDMATKLLAARWGKPENVHTVYNAVDCDYWANHPDKTEARKLAGLPADKIILGMVCRLVDWKGCDDAVRLLERLPERYHLAIAGDGPEKTNILKLAAASKVDHRIHMLGLIEDVRVAYSAMDNLLFLSRTEPFGLLLAEAMAAGVPIVGLAGPGGYREKSYPLVTAETALLLERPNPAESFSPAPASLLDLLALTIQTLNGSPEIRESMTKRAKSWVRARFGMDRYTRVMTTLYWKLVAKGRG